MGRYLAFVFVFAGFFIGTADCGFTIKNGALVDADEVATLTPNQHYGIGISAVEREDWNEAAKQFRILAINFPQHTHGQDAPYYLGIAYFNLKELDFANDSFSSYITAKSHPKYFLEAIRYKFRIAEAFRYGAKRRFWGTKHLPKWASGENLALTIYDEVVAALPGNDLAAEALYSKACMLWKMKEFRESIENFQMVCKRFPKNELTPQCYVNITKVFLEQSEYEFQNPDLLAFAQINLKRFKQAFPKEEHLVEAENDVLAIKEVYAKGLYETGMFYERVHKPRASIIYYKNALTQFPDTQIAQLCIERLSRICPDFEMPVYSPLEEQLQKI